MKYDIHIIWMLEKKLSWLQLWAAYVLHNEDTQCLNKVFYFWKQMIKKKN